MSLIDVLPPPSVKHSDSSEESHLVEGGMTFSKTEYREKNCRKSGSEGVSHVELVESPNLRQ
jgi:hypothetical protein